jgi:hypothetical protein
MGFAIHLERLSSFRSAFEALQSRGNTSPAYAQMG